MVLFYASACEFGVRYLVLVQVKKIDNLMHTLLPMNELAKYIKQKNKDLQY